MALSRIIVPLLTVAALWIVVSRAARPPAPVTAAALPPADSIRVTVGDVDRLLTTDWTKRTFVPAEPADELAVLRRLSLALHGALPSIEELQAFRNDRRNTRLERWLERMLADRRFEEYFAERLARSMVGTEGGAFLIFRRDRFVDWLAAQLKVDRPWNEVVTAVISEQGLWTGKPATNFITAAVADDNLDRLKLAGRTVRAFLGQRIDCAQCHDHPFGPWKQAQFESLAAFYGNVDRAMTGIEDGRGKFEIEDPKTLKKRTPVAGAPYSPEFVPKDGTLRQKLAGWVTHKDNRRFARALSNRVWGLMFGKPYFAPVDDVPDPGAPGKIDMLDVLANDFVKHGWHLKRLVRILAGSRAFRLASIHPEQDERKLAKIEEAWGVFPLVRLRPEQVIGAMLQSASVKTVDRNANVFQRFVRFIREADFVKAYGDFGDTELDERGGTIPQRLLMLNGKLVRELSEPNPFQAPGRIAALAPTDAECLEMIYLACLTRTPTADEEKRLLPLIAGKSGDGRGHAVQDLYWTLINSTEFSWNH